jgi:hypothetical protein
VVLIGAVESGGDRSAVWPDSLSSSGRCTNIQYEVVPVSACVVRAGKLDTHGLAGDVLIDVEVG